MVIARLGHSTRAKTCLVPLRKVSLQEQNANFRGSTARKLKGRAFSTALSSACLLPKTDGGVVCMHACHAEP